MANTNNFCVTCVDDYCTESVTPALVSACEVMNDEDFTEMLLTDQGHPVTGDPTLAGSWTPRLSNTSNGDGTTGNVANPIRSLKIINGKMPAPTTNVKRSLSGNQGKVKESDYAITWEDDDDSDAKNAMYRGYQCNGNVLAYPRSGKHFYGKNKNTGAGSGVGITGFIECNKQVDSSVGEGGGHRWICKFSWRATCMTDRFLAPI